jgi:hypothetical protein
VPTIDANAFGEMVGKLRFAHPDYRSDTARQSFLPCTQCSSICSAVARSSSEALAKARL